MGLDYSQKRLIGKALSGKKGKRARQLQLYAFFTGLMSTFISFVNFLLQTALIHHG